MRSFTSFPSFISLYSGPEYKMASEYANAIPLQADTYQAVYCNWGFIECQKITFTYDMTSDPTREVAFVGEYIDIVELSYNLLNFY